MDIFAYRGLTDRAKAKKRKEERQQKKAPPPEPEKRPRVKAEPSHSPVHQKRRSTVIQSQLAIGVSEECSSSLMSVQSPESPPWSPSERDEASSHQSSQSTRSEEKEDTQERSKSDRITLTLSIPPKYSPVKFQAEEGAIQLELQKIKKQSRLTSFFKSDAASSSAKSEAEVGGFQNATGWRCPSYKRVPGSPYVVDAFRYGYIPEVKGYFLSHFHSDHYEGLNRQFSKPLYCSKVTANLLKLRQKASSECIRALELGREYILPDGTIVTLLDANHCPGSVMFLFKTKGGKQLLHTGDLRASPALVAALQSIPRLHIDTLFLDTTYCDPEYSFPDQDDVIEETSKLVQKEVARNPRILVVVGTYLIGKERLVLALSRALQRKIFVERGKRKVLECLEDEDLTQRLTEDAKDLAIHIVFGKQTEKELRSRLAGQRQLDEVLGIWPSGWEFKHRSGRLHRSKDGKVLRLDVAYSEHSSFSELKNLVQALGPKTVIPTVDFKKRAALQEMFFQPWLTQR